MSEIEDNLRSVQDRIAAAAARVGKAASDITLVCVTKRVPPPRILAAFDAGIRDFGENYVQELEEKRRSLPDSIRWHYIGHLQSNKARFVAGQCSLVHSVDSVGLAKEIAKRSVLLSTVQPVLLEVKLDPSPAKSGILPESIAEVASEIDELQGVALRGLMGMPPYSADSESSRPHFQTLQTLFQALPEEHRYILSMGMSGDFEVAIEEGATHVRVGTAIFGAR